MEDMEPLLTDEYAEHMRRWSKLYLQRVSSSVHTIAQIESEIAELDAMMDGVRALDPTRERVNAPANDDAMVNAISRKEALRAKYDEELESHLQVKAAAHAALANVRQPWRKVLTYRYLLGLSWKEVAEKAGFSKDHCKSDLHENGLLELYPFIPHDELPEAM